jgi:hypothetical protein
MRITHLRRYGFGNELATTFFASDYRLIWEELGNCWKIVVIFVEITTLKYDALTGQLQKAGWEKYGDRFIRRIMCCMTGVYSLGTAERSEWKSVFSSK